MHAIIDRLKVTTLEKRQAFCRRIVADILFKNTDIRFELALKNRIYRDRRNKHKSHEIVSEEIYRYYESLKTRTKLKVIHVPKQACRILYRDGSESAIVVFLWLLHQQRKNLWFTFQSHLQRLQSRYGVNSRKSLNGLKELRDLRIIEKIDEGEAVSKIQDHGFTYRWGKAIGVNLGIAKRYVPDSLLTY